MGNEHSKNKELTQNGKIPEKHENGSANGLSVNITSNGLEIEVNGETVVQQNGGSHSLNHTESTEPDFVVVESDCQHADPPVISEILETTTQKEEVKKSKEEKVRLFGKMFKKKAEPPADEKNVQEKETSGEDQTDVSLPASDPQLESGSSGDEAAAMIIAELREDFKYLHRKAETSTQTDRKSEADISTQTGADDDESAVVIAEEAADETADQEPFDNQTAGMIIEEVVIENNEYENIVLRGEQVDLTDNSEITHIKNCDPEEESEPGVAAESESNPNKDIIEGETVAEENSVEETVPLEISASLLKAVVDCVEVVFAAVSEYTDVAAANTSEPSVEEVITKDDGEGARDMSADVELIETAEPESNAVAPEAEETNGVPSPDEEPMTAVMETISEVVCEDPKATPENQHVPAEELSVPLVTEILVKVESALEDVTADDAVAVMDAPGISEESISVEAPSNELTTIEELPEDTLNSPEDEVNLESIPEVITTDESVEVTEDLIADVTPETVAEVNSVEETMPMEISSSLPKVVVDCVEVVLAAVSESTDFAASNTPQPSVEEVITEDDGEGTRDRPADVALIETAEAETNAVAPDAQETNDVPSPDEEPMTAVMETISRVPAEELSVPLKVESAHEEVSEDMIANVGPETVEEAEPSPVLVKDDAEVIQEAAIDALSQEFELRSITPHEPVMDNGIPLEEEVISATSFVPLSGEQEANLTIPEEPSKGVAEDMVEEAIEALSNEFEAVPERVEEDTSTEEPVEENPNPCEEDATTEVSENTLESVVEAILERLEVTEIIVEEPADEQADVPQMNTTDEPEPSLSVQEKLTEENVALSVVAVTGDASSEEPVEENTEVSALAQAPEEIPVISEEPVGENPISCEEDATTEVLEDTLESVVEAILEKLEVTENTVEEPADEQAGVSQMDATDDPESCLSVQEELIEETIPPSVFAVEEPADSSPVISEEAVGENPIPRDEDATTELTDNTLDSVPVVSEEPVENSASRIETQVLVVIPETTEDEATDEIVHETDDSGDVLDAIDEHPEDSLVTISDEPLAECIEAVLEATVAELITGGVAAECNLVTCEEAPEIITKGENEEKAENESSVNSTNSTQSAEMTVDTSVISTDMEAFLLRLQSACTSTAEESAFRLDGLKMSSVGYSITVTIHVAPKEEQR